MLSTVNVANIRKEVKSLVKNKQMIGENIDAKAPEE